jgi:hypothetical protein
MNCKGCEIKRLFRCLSGGTEDNHERTQDSRYPGRDCNRVPPEYKFEALPLKELARFEL